jgi:hypothetical protein
VWERSFKKESVTMTVLLYAQSKDRAWNRSVLVTDKLRQFPVAGLGPFLTAGGLHLAIIQERALRDPEVNDPNDSSWAKIYVDVADNFISYVGSQPDKIVSERAAHITPVAFRQLIRNVPRHGPIDESYWWFEDRLWVPPLRKMPKRAGWDLQMAQDQRTNHYRQVIDPLTKALAPAKETARHWRVAREAPLPQVET